MESEVESERERSARSTYICVCLFFRLQAAAVCILHCQGLSPCLAEWRARPGFRIPVQRQKQDDKR